MSLKSQTLPLNGMNNKVLDTALQKDKARNAVNVLFTDEGTVIFPRQGKTLIYSGSCHSIFHGKLITLFVDGSDLYRLNEDNTSTVLISDWGLSNTYYVEINDIVYCSNEAGRRAKIRSGFPFEWGTDRPTRQPDCAPIATGGLFAGDYRVALTWLADEESGTGMGRKVTVADGGGIRVHNLPTPPDYVTGFAIYVSSVNSKDMYKYGEYPLDIPEVHIGRFTSDGVLPTVPLETQFCYPPKPMGKPFVVHHGRLYYGRGKWVYFTEPQRYGLQKATSCFPFNSGVETLSSTPNTLYAGTDTLFGKVTNIDSSDGSPPIFEPLQLCGTVKGSEVDDPDGISTYVMSNRGLLKCTPDSVTELTYNSVAIPYFKIGSASILEHNGLKYLVGVFQDGVQNPLADQQVNISELARGSL